MADLGIARPQELLTSLPGRIDPAPVVPRIRQAAHGREYQRRRPEDAAQAPPPQESVPDLTALEQRVERLNQEAKDYHLRFEVNQASGRVVIHIVDAQSGEVLRTVPPSAVLNLQDHLGNDAGRLIDSQS
jgi:flagellar protein FlaG